MDFKLCVALELNGARPNFFHYPSFLCCGLQSFVILIWKEFPKEQVMHSLVYVCQGISHPALGIMFPSDRTSCWEAARKQPQEVYYCSVYSSCFLCLVMKLTCVTRKIENLLSKHYDFQMSLAWVGQILYFCKSLSCVNGIGLYWQSIEALVLILIATYPGTLKFVISPFFDKEQMHTDHGSVWHGELTSTHNRWLAWCTTIWIRLNTPSIEPISMLNVPFKKA